MSGDLRDAIVDAAIAWARAHVYEELHHEHDIELYKAVQAWERATAQWVETYWEFVVDGDEIRFDHRVVGVVESAGMVGEWHVDPRSNTYRPTPLKHFLKPIRIVGRSGILQVDPHAPIEIKMGPVRRAMWEMQRGLGAEVINS